MATQVRNCWAALLAASVLGACTTQATIGDTHDDPVDTGLAWPQQEWAEGEPGAHGMDGNALEALREYAFADGFNTQAVLVVKDGVLLAEWYAAGSDSDSLVTSWSGAKSVTSALIGVGMREGLLDLDDTIGTYVADWAEGPNAVLTIRHLLEMRSGLNPNNTNEYGVYVEEPDQLSYSLERVLSAEPGAEFQYVNEDSMVLGEVIAQAFEESAGQAAQREIFEPIGLDAAWWTDGADHTLTYCCIDTTARDFARFGLLYARGGAWRDQQIVPAEFVTESTTGISYYGYYGMHWWTYGQLFAAIGYHGQFLYVHPGYDLVVARFGSYSKHGSGTVRTGYNYHETLDFGAFNPETFKELFLAAVTDP